MTVQARSCESRSGLGAGLGASRTSREMIAATCHLWRVASLDLNREDTYEAYPVGEPLPQRSSRRRFSSFSRSTSAGSSRNGRTSPRIRSQSSPFTRVARTPRCRIGRPGPPRQPRSQEPPRPHNKRPSSEAPEVAVSPRRGSCRHSRHTSPCPTCIGLSDQTQLGPATRGRTAEPAGSFPVGRRRCVPGDRPPQPEMERRTRRQTAAARDGPSYVEIDRRNWRWAISAYGGTSWPEMDHRSQR